MIAALAVAALAGLTAVQALPISQLATVEASLSTPNSTQYNASVVDYWMNGNAGACGWYNQDKDVVVGLPNEFYQDLSSVSAYCGKYVVVVDPRDNTTVTALVADASTGDNKLSVSQGTWKALKGTDSKLKFVDWRFANSTETEAAKAALQSASSAPSSTYVAPAASSPAADKVQEQTQAAAAPSKPSSTEAPVYKAEATTTYAPQPTTTTTEAPQPTTTEAPQPTTTQAAATTAAYKEASASSSGSYSGRATFYSQGGAPGSCGNYAQDSDYVVAVNESQMNSGWCGKTVKITNTSNGKSITATVADTCPGCSYGSLDLSTGAFGALGSYDSGVLPITWGFA